MSTDPTRNLSRIASIFDEVLVERANQFDRYGTEDIPSIDPTLLYGRTMAERTADVASIQAAERYEIPTARRARHLRERAGSNQSWPAIVVEELSESVEAACKWGDGPLLRAEIIQTIATLVAWLENIDRRD